MLLSKISIVISIVAILIAAYIQYELVIGYELTSGKGRALYGLKQLFYLKYMFIGILGLILSIVSVFKKEKLKTIVFSFSLGVLAILLLILEVWRFFI